MRNALLHLLSLALGAQLFAQDAPPVRTFQPYTAAPQGDQTTPGQSVQADPMTLTEGPGIERTMARFSEVKHVQNGFRVQIFLGDRKSAEDTKRAFLQSNPDTPAYLSWLAPNFRLRVGDLRTRLEAEHLLRDMKVSYPGSYIVADEIEMQRMR